MTKVTQPVIGRVGLKSSCSLRNFRTSLVLHIRVSHRPRQFSPHWPVWVKASEEKGEGKEVVGGGHAQVEILSFFQ